VRIIFTLFVALGVAGCSSLPSLPSEDKLPIDAIVDAVQCELKTALTEIRANPDHKFIESWLVGMAFTFNATDSATLSPDLSLVIPVFRLMHLAGGNFTGGIHADLTCLAKRTVNFKLGFAFSDMDKYVCTPGQSRGYQLTSNLGIYEWLDRALSAVTQEDRVGQPIAIGTTIQYTVTDAGKLSPTLTLQRLADVRKTVPSAVLGASRIDDQILDITFLPRPAPAPKPKPVEVIVVGDRRP
jgi:hypothetical protein